MFAIRSSIRFAAIVILGLPCMSSGAPADYVNFTAADSAGLAGVTVERFLFRSGLECPYTLIRHGDGEVKGFLVLLHGAGDNPTNFTKIATRLGLRGMQHILPRAPFPMSIRLPDPLTGREESFAGYGWLDDPTSPWVDRGTALSAFTVGSIIDEVRPAHAEGPPLVLAGFRQAAGIAALWAAANPGRVQGLVLVSGYAEPPVQEALAAGGRGLALQDMPCLVLIGIDAPDAVDSGDLAATVRDLGARIEPHFVARGADFSELDYGLIRAFVERCTGAIPAAEDR
ncbi:hypothetical protein JXA88_00295 [Candidatus Fermentibacteria bacterium]|nr:hypothetical protein [Candidatus Fermentibacteria bacterium]